ncbi:hypothetical protein QM042_02115 [Escherichia coli]|uniref:hypothetical protein n=1 Tax=Escherichia coli TaxID=562 RepID=UPI003987D588
MFVLNVDENVHNEYYVNRIAGIAGTTGCAVEFINEVAGDIRRVNDQERKKVNTDDDNIFLMLKAFVEMGFKISLHK